MSPTLDSYVLPNVYPELEALSLNGKPLVVRNTFLDVNEDEDYLMGCPMMRKSNSDPCLCDHAEESDDNVLEDLSATCSQSLSAVRFREFTKGAQSLLESTGCNRPRKGKESLLESGRQLLDEKRAHSYRTFMLPKEEAEREPEAEPVAEAADLRSDVLRLACSLAGVRCAPESLWKGSSASTSAGDSMSLSSSLPSEPSASLCGESTLDAFFDDLLSPSLTDLLSPSLDRDLLSTSRSRVAKCYSSSFFGEMEADSQKDVKSLSACTSRRCCLGSRRASGVVVRCRCRRTQAASPSTAPPVFVVDGPAGSGAASSTEPDTTMFDAGSHSDAEESPDELAPPPASGEEAFSDTRREEGQCAAGAEVAAAETTFMIRGLPNSMNRREMAKWLDAQGFAATYDFLYLPADIKMKGCFGYGFINFVDASEASQHFVRQFDGYEFSPGQEPMGIHRSQALQGMEQLVERYRNSPMMHRTVPPGVRPAIYRNGIEVTFPAPTEYLRPPRVRKANSFKAKPPPPRRPSSPRSRAATIYAEVD